MYSVWKTSLLSVVLMSAGVDIVKADAADHQQLSPVTTASDFSSEAQKIAYAMGLSGVKETPSGLLYQLQAAGQGAIPQETDTVVVHYTGSLVDGTQFDSSHQRGEPTSFVLNRVIPGWIEGLQLIKKGGKIKLIIPPHLAYGAQGAGDIPGNATLIFDIELIDINPSPVDKQK